MGKKQTQGLWGKKNLWLSKVKGGEINWEFGIDMYTLLYLKQITNKDLPCSTGSSLQCYVTEYKGKGYE